MAAGNRYRGTVSRELNPRERKGIKDMIGGKMDVNSNKAQELLQRPDVAITFEGLLDRSGLSDNVLAKRLKNIVARKATKGKTTTGSPTTNITAIDANVINTVRMIWQARGKFVEKHELGSPGTFAEMDNKQLDAFINNGLEFLRLGGKNALNRTNNTNTN